VSAPSEFERAQLAQQLTEQIQRFEPRLEQVRVKLQFDAQHPRSVVGSIEAVLRVESLAEPVSFPLLVNRTTGQTQIESW
jgi:predicted component of type VI protein secretion system